MRTPRHLGGVFRHSCGESMHSCGVPRHSCGVPKRSRASLDALQEACTLRL